jgi:hypothetical protein
VIRILIAVAIAVLFFTKVITGTLGIILLVLGAIFVLTSLVGFCPLYWPFGINSGKNRTKTVGFCMFEKCNSTGKKRGQIRPRVNLNLPFLTITVPGEEMLNCCC